MDYLLFAIFLCGGLGIGIGLPFIFYMWARKGGADASVNPLQRLTNGLSQPFKRQQDDLNELSRRVDELKRKQDPPTQNDTTK